MSSPTAANRLTSSRKGHLGFLVTRALGTCQKNGKVDVQDAGLRCEDGTLQPFQNARLRCEHEDVDQHFNSRLCPPLIIS